MRHGLQTKMGIDYFEIMEKEFQTNCMSYLGNFSDEEFVKECQKINITKLHEDITWLLTQPKHVIWALQI